MSSEHDCPVVRLGDIIKHDNADTLGITEVDGRPCIVRLGEWNPGDLAVYIPIDSLVPVADPRFAFLAPKANGEGKARIRAMRLRGVFSMGLLVKAEDGMTEGDDVRERLGIEVYEADASMRRGPGGSFISGDQDRDPGVLPKYDVESARKYRRLLVEGEEVVLTEKVHGANARFVWHDGRLHCGSRTTYKKEGTGSMWWAVAERYELARLADHEGIALFGEVYGQVQDLKYGCDDHRLVLFDAMDYRARRWLDYDAFRTLASSLGLPVAPELYRGPWSDAEWETYRALAEGPTVIGAGVHVREGWVLRPTTERFDARLGRVQMKLVGEGYLTRKSG